MPLKRPSAARIQRITARICAYVITLPPPSALLDARRSRWAAHRVSRLRPPALSVRPGALPVGRRQRGPCGERPMLDLRYNEDRHARRWATGAARGLVSRTATGEPAHARRSADKARQ